MARRPSDMILVSHAYLGGTKARWWRSYESALDSKYAQWRKFDDWIRAVELIALPYASIPVNREVKYQAPKPAMPLDQMETVPGLDSTGQPPRAAPDGLLCQ